MTSEDLVLLGALGVISTSVAYLLGRRQVPTEAPAPNLKPVRATAREATPTAKPASQSTTPVAVKAKAPEPAPAPRKELEPAVEKLSYEEDENVDPTRVGVGAANAVARKVYSPPLKRIVYDEDGDIEEPTRQTSLFVVHATAQTDTGLRRKRNEDSVLTMESEHLYVIADGMGGHKGGQLASQTAVKTMEAAFKSQTFEGPAHEGVPADATNLARAIQMANAAILELAQRQPELEGMGTTLCAARFSPNKERLFIGHVGDSRCYRLRDGALSQMTADHTMADHGVTGPASAQLSRAVGVWPTVPIDIVTAVPHPGDVYLLCSDGLTKMLPDEMIASVLHRDEEPKTAVESLIALANARGGRDNITVILARIVPPNWKPSLKGDST